ncbi:MULTISPECIES: hypothetical protein [unclassified Streptomyces]|uniref:hypothetical protein n=1 Tax=unclassified Streptomyces TaxID=2593676 RepID=UPI002E2C74E8|nr:hypothetical protein [Streptomyces sp. NBC_00223]
MIKEGTGLYVEGHPVKPFHGKYAVKTPDVFTLARERWAAAGLDPDAPYLPMRVELELTTKCDDSCPSCGMGALPLDQGRTLTDGRIGFLLDQFESIGLPSIAITGGEPFTAWRALLRMVASARGRIDISKLTTNGSWGTERRCAPVFGRLERAGWLDSRLFVPLLMLSIGEQTTPLEYVARILHHAVTHYTEHQLNVAVSSLADPATREHRLDALVRVYEAAYGNFPHDRVHSTMRVYLVNERLDEQAPVHRPGHTTIERWMDNCFDCFAPTVGAYVLPTSLLKQNGDWYSCAAFNVPERLAFGNLLREPARRVLERVNSSAYVKRVRDGGGLAGLHDIVPRDFTSGTTCTSFCDSCSLLIDQHDRATGETTGHRAVPVVPAAALFARPAAGRGVR